MRGVLCAIAYGLLLWQLPASHHVVVWLESPSIIRARGAHPGWSSLAKDGIGFGRIFGFCADMPMLRLLELRLVANRGHSERSRVVPKKWRQVRWRYTQEELHELRLPVLPRLLRSIRRS